MRISDWSSDVCSSDLSCPCKITGRHACRIGGLEGFVAGAGDRVLRLQLSAHFPSDLHFVKTDRARIGAGKSNAVGSARQSGLVAIGRESWRERGCDIGEISGGGV